MPTKIESSAPSSNELTRQGSLLVGKVVSINDHGNPMIAYDETTKSKPVEALTTVPLNRDAIGKDIAISFAQNNGCMAIVMGVIRRPLDDVLALQSEQPEEGKGINPAKTDEPTGMPEVIVDGNKLELSAPEEITLRCGKASITLNKNGKILIKGEHMLNRVSGSYKIKSGSIQLN